MATLTGTQQAAGASIEDGSYEVLITEVVVEDGQYGPQIKTRLRVTKGQDGEGEEFNAWFTLYQNKTTGAIEPIRVGSKTGDLFSAALYGGEPFPEGADLDTDDLIQKCIRILYGERTTKNGQKKRDVLTIKAAKKRTPEPEPVAAAAPARTVRQRLTDEDDDLADA